jgi:4-hydroxythreonine-4-phosphate dehydrogenase
MPISNKKKVPRILLTMGEPAGVGPELIIALAQHPFNAQLIVIADPSYLLFLAQKQKKTLQLILMKWDAPVKTHQPGTLYYEPVTLKEKVILGQLSKKNAITVLESLHKASDLALKQKIKAIVTAPVHKANLHHIDPSFLGHTEFFARLAKIEHVVMMLATHQLRVALVTTHIPLKMVHQEVTSSRVENVLNIIESSFKHLGFKKPNIAVCGLNPHAGESGLLGNEDQKNIAPAIKKCASLGMNVSGPYPADTLFTPPNRKKFSIFLAMYHDQGLPVLKAIGFKNSANITLGLPYIRTSVDHGTALDIAHTYTASSTSFIYAIHYAIQMSQGQLPE